eukprot:4875683-Prymnesium_polylepis.1
MSRCNRARRRAAIARISPLPGARAVPIDIRAVGCSDLHDALSAALCAHGGRIELPVQSETHEHGGYRAGIGRPSRERRVASREALSHAPSLLAAGAPTLPCPFCSQERSYTFCDATASCHACSATARCDRCSWLLMSTRQEAGSESTSPSPRRASRST